MSGLHSERVTHSAKNEDLPASLYEYHLAFPFVVIASIFIITSGSKSSSSSGRFLTQDPFPGSIFEPVSLHRYLYANADPVNNLDPGGESPLVSITVSVAINLNIRSIYIKHLVLAFVDICVIAYCVIEPAASNRKLAMWAIMNGAGAWAYSLEREARVIMAAGFTQISERIKQAYKGMQNEILSVIVTGQSACKKRSMLSLNWVKPWISYIGKALKRERSNLII